MRETTLDGLSVFALEPNFRSLLPQRILRAGGSAEIRANRRHPFLLFVTVRHQRWMLHWFCYLNEIDLNREALAVILLKII